MDTQLRVEKISGNIVTGDFSAWRPRDGGCAECATRALCLTSNIAANPSIDLQDWVDHRRSTAAGKHYFRQGDRFAGLFFVRSGAVKTVRTLPSGHEQITDVCLAGDLFGFEGWLPPCYTASAVALETSSVCFLPRSRLESATLQLKELHHHLFAKLSEALDRQHILTMMLSRNKALERIAVYLFDLSHRFARRHLSAWVFRLSMSRTDISNYLGLSLECVSRAFAQLEKTGLITCSGRHIEIIDHAALAVLAGEMFVGTADRRQPAG